MIHMFLLRDSAKIHSKITSVNKDLLAAVKTIRHFEILGTMITQSEQQKFFDQSLVIVAMMIHSSLK